MFTRFATWAAIVIGHPIHFMGACITVGIWAGTGPLFGFSDTWQLFINTGTTVLTWLMVALLQHTQNRDTAEVLALLRQLVKDLPDVDEEAARRQIDA